MKKEVSNRLVLVCFVANIATLQSCLKEADLPTLTTTEVSNIKIQSASLGGNVTDDGGAKIDLRGVCWGTADNPTITDSKKYYWKGTGSFTCLVTGLTPDTYYHVRAFATNRVGIAYGNEVHFTSLPLVEPKVTTTSVSFIRYTMAKANGNIECNDETLLFDKGFCLATTENPTNKDRMVQSKLGVGSYFCWLEGLQPGTIYHMRAYAVTLVGIIYGADICFKTRYPPTVTTAVTEFTQTSAIVQGNIIWPDDSLGRISNWGICYGIEPKPTVNGYWIGVWDLFIHYRIFTFIKDGVFTFPLTELTPGTPYYVRAFITILDNFGYRPYSGYIYNNEFTQYGNEVTFTTSQ
jgi:hypothetical protein